jgi:hypothetical protein
MAFFQAGDQSLRDWPESLKVCLGRILGLERVFRAIGVVVVTGTFRNQRWEIMLDDLPIRWE